MEPEKLWRVVLFRGRRAMRKGGVEMPARLGQASLRMAALRKVGQHAAAVAARAGGMQALESLLHQLDALRALAALECHPAADLVREGRPLREGIVLRQRVHFVRDGVRARDVALEKMDQAGRDQREGEAVWIVAPARVADAGVGQPHGLAGATHECGRPGAKSAAHHARVLAIASNSGSARRSAMLTPRSSRRAARACAPP
jgi:hypothetical protein